MCPTAGTSYEYGGRVERGKKTTEARKALRYNVKKQGKVGNLMTVTLNKSWVDVDTYTKACAVTETG